MSLVQTDLHVDTYCGVCTHTGVQVCFSGEGYGREVLSHHKQVKPIYS